MWATNKWKAESKIATNYKSYAKNKLNLVKFKKVKAHSGDEFNELADELAKESILGEFFT
jgi:ribonuclease HI